MRKAKRVTGLLLSVVMFAVAIVTQVPYLPAEGAAPPSGVDYKVSQYTDISQWENAPRLLALTRLAYGTVQPYFFLHDGADVGLPGGKVLGDGAPGKVQNRSTFIYPLSYEDTGNELVYPVNEISGKRQFPLSSTKRLGITFYFSVKAGTPTDNGDGTFTTADIHYGNIVYLGGGDDASVTGLRLLMNPTQMTVTTVRDGSGNVLSAEILAGHTDSGGSTYSGRDLAGMITSDASEQDALISVFNTKTAPLTNEERWVDYRLYNENGDSTKPRLELRIGISVGDETKHYTLTTPFKVINSSTSFPRALAIGNTWHQSNAEAPQNATYMSDMSVHYDISAYQQSLAAEVIEKINELSPYTVDKRAQLENVLAEYNTLSADERAGVVNIGAVTGALAAFDQGKYFYDGFHGGELNWQIAGRVSGTSPVTSSDWPADNPETEDIDERITADDYLLETNEYSTAAVSNQGNNGYAFWGIAGDPDSADNSALWLRKSFNPYNMLPTHGDNNNRASVIAVTKGVLPAGAKITSISGRMHIQSLNSYKQVVGIAFRYADEYSWTAAGISGEGRIRSVRRTNQSVGASARDSDLGATQYREGEGAPNLKINQWVDFSLEYDFTTGCYVYTVEGTDVNNNLKRIVIQLNAGTELLSEVGLVNAGACAPSFDDISVSILNYQYADMRISQLPDPEAVTLDDEAVIREVQTIFNNLPAEQKALVQGAQRMSGIVNRLNQLIEERDGSLSLDEPLTFEPQQPGIEYFESVGAAVSNGWGVVNNPNKSGVNTSDNVLMISRNYTLRPDITDDNNRSIYKIKDSIMPGDRLISNISGKVYLTSGGTTTGNTTTLIYDYVSESDWRGIQIHIWDKRIAIYTAEKTNPVGNITIGNRSAATMETAETAEFADGVWVEFNIEYSLLECFISMRAIAADGKSYTGEIERRFTLSNTCEAKFAVATGAASCYIDDIRVNYQDAPDYVDAGHFRTVNRYILNLIPAETYLSDIDRDRVTGVLGDYAQLDPAVLRFMPFMDLKVQNIRNALDALDSDPAAAQKKAKDQALLAEKNKFTGDYSGYTVTEDFEDGLRIFQPAKGINNTGKVTTEYNEEFGSNVLRMDGIATLTLKELLLPDRPQVSSIQYRIKLGMASDQYYRLRVYYNYLNNRRFNGFGFHDPIESPVNYRAVTPTASASPVSCELKMDTIWTVKIEYNYIGRYTLTIVDGYNNEFNTNGSAEMSSILALAGFNRLTYIDDLTVTYRKGNYDVDQVSDDINVYYTANTWVSAGEVALLSGENLAANVSAVEILAVPNGTYDSSVLKKGFVDLTRFDYDGVHEGEFSAVPSSHYWNTGAAQRVDIIQKTPNSLKFIIPTENPDGSPFLSGLYAVRIYSNKDASFKTVYINAPSIDYTVGTDGAASEPGGEMRVIGKNLAPDGNANNLRAVMVDSTGAAREIAVTKVQSNYSVSVAVPADAKAGSYELWLYNGYGDAAAWTIPVKFMVDVPVRSKWSQTVFNVKDYGAVGDANQNATPYIINALAALSKNGGGVLYLPNGAYSIESEIIIPQNCVFTGETMEGVTIAFRPFGYNHNAMPTSLFRFEKNVELSNFGFVSSRCSGVFRAYGSSSDNVYIENVQVYIQPYAGTASDAGKPYSRLMSSSELYALAASESVSPVLSFQTKGNNVQIRNFDASQCYGVNRPIVNDANGSYYWQVDNVKTTGHWSEIVISNSIWENSEHGPNSCMGVWGHGLYFAGNKLFDLTISNRELYVADRSADYAGMVVPLSDAADNRVFDTTKEFSGERAQNMQLYVRSGQGVGQTRHIVSSVRVRNSEGVYVSRVTIDRPFTIAPNRNSDIIIRRPRENIFFVKNQYSNGSCGGFYGGVADVVYDGNTFTGCFGIYQQGIFNDVNWYLSILNETVTHDASLGNMGSVTSRRGFDWEALSGVNAQMCFLQRNCSIDGMYSYLRADATNGMVDVIVENNEWSNNDYAFSFYNNAQGKTYNRMDGIVFTRNRYSNIDTLFDPVTAAVPVAAMATTNSASSKRMLVLDKVGEITSALAGDVNGDGKVSLKDSTLICYAVVGRITLTESQNTVADVDDDGVVTLKDSTMIRLYIVSAIDGFNS